MGDAAKYVILLGAPGAGKGTQADILQRRMGLVHVSSGDLFRENISKQTELGTLAKSYMDKGELVPDDVTVRMVLDRIGRADCVHGVVFDGFPRTEAQAKALSAALMRKGKCVNAAVLVSVRDQTLIERLSARWVCPIDGAVYNMLSNPPKDNGRCDKDGSALEQRNDDKPETVRRRLDVFHTQTKPLIDYYRAEGLLYEVDGERAIEQVQADLAQILEKL
jgi:adenylate kinase